MKCFCCTLSRKQLEEVDGEGHLNKPSVEPGRSLWGASRGMEPCLLLFVTSVFLCFLSLSCPVFTFSFLVSICSIFLYFSISYLFLSSSPSFALRHHGQLFFQTGCLQLSEWSWVTVQEVGGCLAHGSLYQHLCLLSTQHPWPEHDLDTTTKFSSEPPTHIAWKYSIGDDKQKIRRYSKVFKQNRHCKIKHSFVGAAFTVNT